MNEVGGQLAAIAMGKFIFTCSIFIWVFSNTEVDTVPSLDSPSFNIEKAVNLEATVSCGKGMFQNQQSSTCLSEHEGTVGSRCFL